MTYLGDSAHSSSTVAEEDDIAPAESASDDETIVIESSLESDDAEEEEEVDSIDPDGSEDEWEEESVVHMSGRVAITQGTDSGTARGPRIVLCDGVILESNEYDRQVVSLRNTHRSTEHTEESLMKSISLKPVCRNCPGCPAQHGFNLKLRAESLHGHSLDFSSEHDISRKELDRDEDDTSMGDGTCGTFVEESSEYDNMVGGCFGNAFRGEKQAFGGTKSPKLRKVPICSKKEYTWEKPSWAEARKLRSTGRLENILCKACGREDTPTPTVPVSRIEASQIRDAVPVKEKAANTLSLRAGPTVSSPVLRTTPSSPSKSIGWERPSWALSSPLKSTGTLRERLRRDEIELQSKVVELDREWGRHRRQVPKERVKVEGFDTESIAGDSQRDLSQSWNNSDDCLSVDSEILVLDIAEDKPNHSSSLVETGTKQPRYPQVKNAPMDETRNGLTNPVVFSSKNAPQPSWVQSTPLRKTKQYALVKSVGGPSPSKVNGSEGTSEPLFSKVKLRSPRRRDTSRSAYTRYYEGSDCLNALAARVEAMRAERGDDESLNNSGLSTAPNFTTN